MNCQLSCFKMIFSICIFLQVLIQQSVANSSSDIFPRPLIGCAILGFQNATLNKCGYCVGSETGLPSNYGEDCSGRCLGGAQMDCEGVCNGNSFRDECSGRCISDEELDRKSINRDCRGVCVQEQLTPSKYLYRRDDCGVCRLQSGETKSPFLDCTGKCSAPGLQRSNEVCGRCVLPMQEKLLLDSCGNCISENIFCSCERDPSLCGCRDARNCYSIKKVEPQITAIRVERAFSLIGYFYPATLDLHCIFKHQITAEIITGVALFQEANRTSVQCSLLIPRDGLWVVGLRSLSARRDFFGDTQVTVFSYNRDLVRFTSVSPTTIFTQELENPITLKFKSLSGNLPSLPLKCPISNSTSVESRFRTQEGIETNTCILSSKQPVESQVIFVTPTYDGLDSVGDTIKVVVVAPVPGISQSKSFISVDGLAIIITFEKPVNVEEMNPEGSSLCTQVLSLSTLRSLSDYDVISCAWATKIQFMVYLSKPITGKQIDINFSPGCIKEDAQVIALSNKEEMIVKVRKLSAEWWSFPPKLLITGPSEVPRCGAFALTGHYSSPRGSYGVQYKWTVTKGVEDSKTISGLSVTDQELKLFVELSQRQHLLLDSIAFAVGVTYQFTLTASLEGEETLIASHRLVKFDFDAPIVSIYSNLMLPLFPYTSNQQAVFWAEAYVPACVHPFQKVNMFWKVIDPRIRFNFSLTYSPVHVVAPFSLPEEQPITFFVNSFLGHRALQSSGAGFTILSQPAPLQAVILSGSPMVCLGTNSGPLVLTTSGSGRGKVGEKLQYQWTCVDSESHQPCYRTTNDQTHFSKNKDFLLISRFNQRSKELIINSNELEPGKELIFALQVMDLNDTSKVSETELILVKVLPGNAPQVVMGAIYVQGKSRATVRSPHNLAFVVPANVDLTVKGHIKGATEIKRITWSSANFVHPLNWISRSNNYDEVDTELQIPPGIIHPFGVNVVKLTVCNFDDVCSEVSTQFTASQSVTGCQVRVDSYDEFELITVMVENCNCPPGFSPLRFQLTMVDPSLPHEIPVTTPQFSSVFIIPGPSPPTGRSATFSAKVCDIFESCQSFYSNTVEVRPSPNITKGALDLIDQARKINIAGDTAAATSVVSNILRKKSLPSHLQELAIAAIIDYTVVGLQIPSNFLTKGRTQVIYSSLGQVFKLTNDSLTQRKALNAMHKVTLKAIAWEAVPVTSSSDSLLQTILTSAKRASKKEDLLVLSSTRQTVRSLLESIAKTIPLGGRIELGRLSLEHEQIPEAYSVIVHDNELQDITLSTLFNTTASVEVNINFGEEIKKDFSGPWKCDLGQDCHSVIFSVTLYPRGGPFPSKKKSYRITPVIDVSIYSPTSGKEQKVKDYLNALTLTITNTGSDLEGGGKYLTRCHFWSEKENVWKTDGVHSSGSSGGKSTCWTGHLTSFTVFRVPDVIETGALVGLVVASLMTVLVIGLCIICCIHKCHQTESARISAQQLVIQRYE